MEPIQIIAILFALFAFSRAVLRVRAGEITAKEFIFWSAIWILVIVVVLMPSTTTFVSSALGVGRPIDLVVYGGIVSLFYLIFRLYVKIEHTERLLTKLTREIALKKPKK